MKLSSIALIAITFSTIVAYYLLNTINEFLLGAIADTTLVYKDILIILLSTGFLLLVALLPTILLYYLSRIIYRLKIDLDNTLEHQLPYNSKFKILEIQNIYDLLNIIQTRLLECRKSFQIDRDLYEKQQKTIIDFVDFAIVAVNSKLEIVLWNKRAKDLTGFSCEEAIGRSLLELVPENLKDFHEKRISHFFSTKQYGFLVKNQSTQVGHINGKISVCLIHDNLLVAFIEEIENPLKTLYINSAYDILDFSDTIVFSIRAISLDTTFISKAVNRLFGYTYLELYKKGLISIIKDTCMQKFLYAIDILVCRGSATESVTERIEFIHSTGEIVYTEVMFYPIKDKSGVSVSIQGVIKNITSQVIYQQLLENYNAELLSAVDIKTKELQAANTELQEMNTMLIALQKQLNQNLLSLNK